MGLAEQAHIVLHGFTKTDQGETWCEMDDAELDGYTVYRRVPLGNGNHGGFDLVDEKDFFDLKEAKAYAKELAGGSLEIFIDY